MTGDDSFEVWDATGDELDDVRWLLARANEEHRSILPPSAFDPYLALVLDLEARTDAASLLVVRAHGRPIGTVTWFADAEAEGWGAPTGAPRTGPRPASQGRGGDRHSTGVPGPVSASSIDGGAKPSIARNVTR